MQKLWKFKSIDEVLHREIVRSLQLSPLVARLLIQRGVSSPEESAQFLSSDLSALPDPFQMKDMARATHLIRQAIVSQQKILLIGDYDVDGITSSALLSRVLKSSGAQFRCHIPHRINEGYGLKADVIQQAAQEGVKLLITLDCGTTSFEELTLARSLGLDTIVVDHHELLPAGRPPASAFLNPLEPGSLYPTKGLASVGVAFTLARGLAKENPALEIWEHLDLVALGTIADVAPLIGENRILVKKGLVSLQETRKPGVRALLKKTKLDRELLTGEEISFILAPRLNAMGRLGSARASFQLLVTEDLHEAEKIASEMDRQNRLRGSFEREAVRRAIAQVERTVNFKTDRVIVVEDDRWHPGVIGIVAARLTARYHRPAVVIALKGTTGRGSARTIPSFSLVEAFEEVKDHLVEFGGHPAAAGLTIERDRISLFRDAFNQVAHRKLETALLTPSVEVDGELALSDVHEGLLQELELLAPFGPGNPRPIFVSQGVRIPEEARLSGFHPRGISFPVQDGNGRSLQAIQSRHDAAEGFDIRTLRGGSVHLAYSPMRSLRSDGVGVELRLCDLVLQENGLPV